MAYTSHKFALIYSALGECYVGIVQHVRKIGVNEAIKYFGEKCDKSAAKIGAVFAAMGNAMVEVANKAQDADAGSFGKSTTVVKGSFSSLRGPWVIGKNILLIILKVGDLLKNGLSTIVPSVISDDIIPNITSVYDAGTHKFDILKAGNSIQIAGDDLAPDPDAEDEKVFLRNRADGNTLEAEITSSELQIVRIVCPMADDGDYDLVVQTRCGLGESVSLKTATRRVTVAS